MNIEAIVRGLEARRVGSGWMARCPAHDDCNPSLSIKVDGDRVLVHCHAGCTQQAVIDVLRADGLWEQGSWEDSCVTATYDYRDERDELLYQILRYTPKNFRQRRPDGAGGWIWRKHPRQVLYRLREVIEAPIVFVVEGEKDVESLRSHGFVATTNAGGANAPWLDYYTQLLAGREVVIIPDNDTPGWRRATDIARALLGAAARIRLLPVPASTKDISDWFAEGHGECELIEMLDGTHARA